MRLEPGDIVAAVGDDGEYASRWEVLEPFQTTRLTTSYLARNAREEFHDHRVLLTVCSYNQRLLGNKEYVDNVRRRLLHEAEMLTLAHNALPEPVDLFVTENRQDEFQFRGREQYRVSEPVLVTEALSGEPLDRSVAEHGPMAERRALRVARSLADILRELHATGVLTYELRPEDILVNPDDHDRVWIRSCANYQRVGAGGVVLPQDLVVPLSDFAFTAPEVESGRTALDLRADVYSFGALLLFLLTGERVPGVVQGNGGVLLPQLSPETCRLLGRCLVSYPSQRFDGCGALIEALDAALAGSDRPAPPGVRGLTAALTGGAITLRWELPEGWTDDRGLALVRWRSGSEAPPDVALWKVMFEELPCSRTEWQDPALSPGETNRYAVITLEAGPGLRKPSHPEVCAVPIPETWGRVLARALGRWFGRA